MESTKIKANGIVQQNGKIMENPLDKINHTLEVSEESVSELEGRSI